MHARTFRYGPPLALCLALTATGDGHRAEGPKGIEALAKGLKAARPADRIKAAEALGKLGRKAGGAAGALCLAAADPDEGVRHAALGALEAVAPDIQEHVVTLAVDEDIDRHLRASVALLRLGEKGAPAAPLIREHVRLATAAARSDKPAPPLPFEGTPRTQWFRENFKLLGHLPDEQTVAVIAAVAEIDTTPHRDERAVHELRSAVVGSLEQLGKAKKGLRKPITKALLAVLAKRDYQPGFSETSTHAQAVRALRAFGPDAREALPALRKLRYHPQAHIRGAIAGVIKAIEG
jgi:hypothetical protein